MDFVLLGVMGRDLPSRRIENESCGLLLLQFRSISFAADVQFARIHVLCRLGPGVLHGYLTVIEKAWILALGD